MREKEVDKIKKELEEGIEKFEKAVRKLGIETNNLYSKLNLENLNEKK